MGMSSAEVELRTLRAHVYGLRMQLRWIRDRAIGEGEWKFSPWVRLKRIHDKARDAIFETSSNGLTEAEWIEKRDCLGVIDDPRPADVEPAKARLVLIHSPICIDCAVYHALPFLGRCRHLASVEVVEMDTGGNCWTVTYICRHFGPEKIQHCGSAKEEED